MTIYQKPTAISAFLLLGLAGCSDDAQDGRASTVTKVDPNAIEEDAGTTAADSDGRFDPEKATLRLSCRRAVVRETSTAGFVASVSDGDGDVPAAPGMWVRLSPSTGTLRSPEEGGGKTDEDGEVAFSFVAPHFDFNTSIKLEAELFAAGDRVLARDQCSFQIVTKALMVSNPEPDSLVQYQRALPVTVALAADGVTERCADDGGLRFSLSGPAGSGLAREADGELTPELCVDVEPDGFLPSVWVRGGASGGAARLRASIGDYGAELPLRLVGAPAALRIQADESDVKTRSAANLTVTAVDDIGQPVAGVPIALEVSRCAAEGCEGGEGVAPEQITTDADGHAGTAYFAGVTAGAAQIRASVESGPTSSLVVRVQ